MMVLGIGCRKGASGVDILAAIQAVMQRDAVERSHLGALATADRKRDETGIAEAGRILDLPVIPVAPTALQGAADRALSRSERVEQLMGLPSVAECAALAVAGTDAHLLGPRLSLGPVTCAIAARGVLP